MIGPAGNLAHGGQARDQRWTVLVAPCSDAELIQWILRIAVKAMMRDLLEPAEVHRALWALPEYRAAVKSSIDPPECVVVNIKERG